MYHSLYCWSLNPFCSKFLHTVHKTDTTGSEGSEERMSVGLPLLLISSLMVLFLPWGCSGIRGGAHWERCAAAREEYRLCRLRPVRQRHPGGPQHRRRAQLLHAGPSEYIILTSVDELTGSDILSTVSSSFSILHLLKRFTGICFYCPV